MIRIDGSHGEGGGQILRSALTLSALTGKPMRIDNIRAGRRKPGLMAQHRKAVEAAAAVSGARVEGARLGSTALTFEPRGLRSGDYRFDIGTAGSTSLVLQTILLPLAFAGGPSRVTVTGGTHVAWSPCFHYLDLYWLPCLREIGMQVGLKLARAGFYPKGGGRIEAKIDPAGSLKPLDLTHRGNLGKILILSAVANLDVDIAHRQSRQARRRLDEAGVEAAVEEKIVSLPAVGKGTILLLLAEFEGSRCCYTALGERGKPAERVADEAAGAFLSFLVGDGAVDEHLADQLLLPLALVPGCSEIRTAAITGHLLTNAEVLREFLPVDIAVEGEVGRPGVVRVQGRDFSA